MLVSEGIPVFNAEIPRLAAFEKARGRPGDALGELGLDLDDCVEELALFYERYRVANGPHQTEQLVRDIESQAIAQAARGR